jgi:hypothetical protein
MNQGRQKLLFVAQKLGFNPMRAIGTTRAIYDTLPAINTALSQYSFFGEVSSREFPATNVASNQFEANEALSIEAIALFSQSTAGQPVPYTGNALINIVIGSQVVLKDLPIKFSTPQGTSKQVPDAYAVCYLAVPVVIPPLIQFRVEVTAVDAVNPANFPRVGCYLYGLGCLINFQNTL